MAELSEAERDELVEQAVVDAYGDDEQMTGFYTMIEDNIALPLPVPPPPGSEWIAAYRHWAGGQ